MDKSHSNTGFGSIVKAMGLVFGDIGTSPIYTLTVILLLTAPTHDNIMGILSLIFWTLIILVTLEYAILAMSLSSKGEGGTIVLKEILTSKIKSGRKIAFVTFLGFIGVSLLMGDGVITPAISILSAVEGLELIPGIGHISSNTIIIITIAITVLLFAVQSKGTDKVASSFGPIMILWFLALFVSGIISLSSYPGIIFAVSPHYAIEFFINNGWSGFFVLSEVILCATGGEAIYADMGHLGSEPIRKAWYFVFFALIINYFGQGVFALSQGHPSNILFSMVKSQAEILYIPFLILTLLATIIASQAMISAIFSLVYQGIRTHIMPLMKIKYTSEDLKSQIYINAVNWSMLAAVILMILVFRKSGNLAAAYGFAVTATMAISGLFMIFIFRIQRNKLKLFLVSIVFIVNLAFVAAVTTKIPHGGYWSIIIALIPLFTIWLWTYGNNAMRKSFRSLPIDTFLTSYEQIYELGNNIKGTAVFFARDLDMIPPYIVHTIIRGNIIYEHNIMVSVVTMDKPFGVQKLFIPDISEGLSGVEIQIGYMQLANVHKIIKELDVDPKVIFYGVDDIHAKRFLMKLFAVIKRATPNFVQFYELPYNKLHGVVTRLEI
ncbi:MAG: KUP/HAK/KT family potassium transporter [Ignavibacteriaceae bacterium]|jgi:KUP system potassium uptake protein|nr:KUP/HAK/KT family potassium transporter [Ignavibacteriaceae bacterium]